MRVAQHFKRLTALGPRRPNQDAGIDQIPECPHDIPQDVRCGSGDLALLEIQPPGGKRMDASAFLRGRPLPAGSSLEIRE